MATRSVIVRLEAQVGQYIAEMNKAASATERLAKAADLPNHKRQAEESAKAAKAAKDQAAATEKVGTTLLGVGAAAVTGLGLATKAAMDWESAWAGVTKTVDGSPEQMDALEEALRGLAKTLPATHEEIAGVAEAAGQLGVAREDVAAFTKTMVDLGETTNLTAEEAATSIAQMMNIMGTSGDDVDRLGSTLVALGNAGASTEKQILDMSLRIAGAGKLVGASEGEVLALANAMASVGIEAQLGGGVMSRVMQRMYGDVMEGGKGLENLAATAGVSSKEFATAFETDPVRAVDMVVQGLGRVKDEGGNVIQTMTDLGIKGTEETSVMLRLAGAGDLLSESLSMQGEAWESNTALLSEATKRYETTEAKIKTAWNNIKDAGIDAGAALLPVVASVAAGAISLAEAFGSIPEPVQGGLTMLGGVLGVSALAAGGLLTLVPKVTETRKAFQDLTASGSKVPGVLGKIGAAAGTAAAGLVAFEVVKGINNSLQPATASLEEFTQALIAMGDNSGSIDELFAGLEFADSDRLKGEIDGVGDAISRLTNPDFWDSGALFGASLGIENGMSRIEDAVVKTDQAIASAAASGNAKLAADGFKAVADAAVSQGAELSDVADLFPDYQAALLQMATDQEVALGTTSGLTKEQELLNWMMGETPAAMEAAASAADGEAEAVAAAGEAAAIAAAQSQEIIDALTEMGIAADGTITNLAAFSEVLLNTGLIQLSANEAARGFQAAIDEVGTKIEGIIGTYGSLNGILNANADGFNRDSAAGREAEAAFDAVAGSGARLTQALAENGGTQEELQGSLRGTYDSLITAAGQFGITGGQADFLARQVMGIPEQANIDTWMSDYARQKAEETSGAVDRLDGRTATVTTIMREITEKQVIDLGTSRAGTPVRAGQVGFNATGGRLPTSGPGTQKTDGILGVSEATGAPISWLDGGEWIINAKASDKYDGLLAAINRDDPRLYSLPALAGGGRTSREYSTSQMYGAGAGNPPAVNLVAIVENPWTGEQVQAVVRQVSRLEAKGEINVQMSRAASTRRGR